MGRISWKRISQAVEAMEAAGTESGVFSRAIEQLNLLVPSDQAVAVPNVNLREIRQRVGRPNPLMITRNAPPGYWEDYLQHYEALDPRQNEAYYAAKSGVVIVDTSFLYKTEFGHDFLKKNDVRFCLCLSNLSLRGGKGFVVSLYRGGRKPFSENELESAAALFPHIHHLSLLAAGPAAPNVSRAQEAAAAAGLSPREQDVAVLVSERLSIREIADRLFISRHTVEKHMQHIYGKLNANGKADVRRFLLGEEQKIRNY
jgi:DNA-binding CsgD family transcriptional regulator